MGSELGLGGPVSLIWRSTLPFQKQSIFSPSYMTVEGVVSEKVKSQKWARTGKEESHKGQSLGRLVTRAPMRLLQPERMNLHIFQLHLYVHERTVLWERGEHLGSGRAQRKRGSGCGPSDDVRG